MQNVSAYTGSEPYIFISYSHKDSEVMDILHEITSSGYRVWYDEGIKSGRNWADEISMRLKNCSQFVVFISNNAIESENVKDEIHIAVKYRLDMQVIYLEEVKLEGGLELQLDRKQAIHKNQYSTQSGFYNQLIKGLAVEAYQQKENAVSTAKSSMEDVYEIVSTVYSSPFKKIYIAVITKKPLHLCLSNIFIFPTQYPASREKSVLTMKLPFSENFSLRLALMFRGS